jgi:murein DD-endopeptidase MepM/ murein hydrolase activator NlpD
MDALVRRTVSLLVVVFASIVQPGAAAADGTWTWPVTGPVIRGFDPPASPFGAGHRGIDIAAPAGTPVLAPAAGVVTFAGRVAGQLFVSIDHGAGLVSTSSWLSSVSVAKDDVVAQGQAVGASGIGHPSEPVAHLHLGIRLGGAYVDPLDYLSPLGVAGLIRLAPLEVVGVAAALPRSVGPAVPPMPSGGWEPWPAPALGRPVPP